jgi:anti-sigma-K factor RskA
LLGTISPAAAKSIAWPFSNTLGDLTNATLEVSLEPADSPAGRRPTGRILFLGRLFAS